MEIEQYYRIIEYAAVAGIGSVLAFAGVSYLIYRRFNKHLDSVGSIFSESELEQEVNKNPKDTFDRNI